MKLAAFFNSIQSGTDRRSIMHIELLRIIAVCLVIFNHTNTKGFFLFSVSQGSVFYPLYLFISIADKIAVPIFFMISGALLAGKDEPIRDIYKKRVLRIAVVLIAVSLFYYTYDCLSTAEVFSITQFLIKVYSGSVAIELWYLYSYLGILVILPLLRILAIGMKHIYVYISVCQLIIVGIIPIMQYVLSAGTVKISGSFSVGIISSSNIFFFLMGYFFEHVLDKKYYTLRNAVILNRKFPLKR